MARPAPPLLGWACGRLCGCFCACREPSRARAHTPGQPPAPFCTVSRTARSGPGRDGRCPPGPGAGSQPSQLSGHPCHGNPWPPAAENPRLPRSPHLSLQSCGERLSPSAQRGPRASVTVPAGPGLSRAPAGMNEPGSRCPAPAYPQPLAVPGGVVCPRPGRQHPHGSRQVPAEPFHGNVHTKQKQPLRSGIRHVPVSEGLGPKPSEADASVAAPPRAPAALSQGLPPNLMSSTSC